MTVPIVFRSGFPFVNGGRDPFWSLSRSMDRLLEDAWRNAPAASPAFSPRLEVVERDDAFVVTAELPGIEEKDLGVEVHGNLLTLRGEKRSERSAESDGRAWSERIYGGFHRTVELPNEVQSDKVSASFKNGVLEVALPKSDAAKVRNIPVNVA